MLINQFSDKNKLYISTGIILVGDIYGLQDWKFKRNG